MAEYQKKKIIITQKLKNVVYEMMPKTHSDVVYTDKKYKITLTERLCDIAELLQLEVTEISALKAAFEEIVGDAPDTFNTFAEVWRYVNVNGDPKSELISLIDTKQDSEEGKGLSTNDFTDLLKEKLENDYTKEELAELFTIVDNRLDNVDERIADVESRMSTIYPYVDEEDPGPGDVGDRAIWYKIIRRDT